MGEGETITRECNETQKAAARNGSGMHEHISKPKLKMRFLFGPWAWRIMCLHVVIAI
jgi:hypothetical protein